MPPTGIRDHDLVLSRSDGRGHVGTSLVHALFGRRFRGVARILGPSPSLSGSYSETRQNFPMLRGSRLFMKVERSRHMHALAIAPATGGIGIAAAFVAVLGCTRGESRSAPRVVEEPSSAAAGSDASYGTSVPASTLLGAATSPCAHLSDRLSYLPATASELCDAARCRSAGGECALAGRVCPSVCVRRSTDSGKACRAREDCEGQCLAPENAANGQRVVGRCSSLRWNAGCFKAMRDGVAAEICVD